MHFLLRKYDGRELFFMNQTISSNDTAVYILFRVTITLIIAYEVDLSQRDWETETRNTGRKSDILHYVLL
jgi:hypothetical protein